MRATNCIEITGTTFSAPRCLIATCLTWGWISALARTLSAGASEVVAFCPTMLGNLCEFGKTVQCSSDPAKAASELQDYLRENHFDHVIFADDLLLRATLSAPDPEAQRTWFPIDITDKQIVDFVISKYSFIEMAHALGIPVPEYRFAADADEAVSIARDMGYAVLLKGDRGFGGLEVRPAQPRTTRESADLFISLYKRVLVQKRISGFAVSVCALFSYGNLMAYKVFRAECQFPDPNSPSTVHSSFAHESIEPILSKLGLQTGFNGMSAIDFMYDPLDDKLYLLEMNPRPSIGFAGTIADRKFFGPILASFLRSEVPARPYVFNYNGSAQYYFPYYLFYLLTKFDFSGKPLSHLSSCISEFHKPEWRLLLWQCLRFFIDGFLRLGSRARTAIPWR